MKLIIRIVVIGLITYFVSPYLTWWTGMVAAFIVCYASPSSGLNAFIAGFLGMGLVWLGYAWKLDIANDSAFSSVVAELLEMNDPILLVLASGLLGGIAGGFSGISGSGFRMLFVKQKSRSPYNQ